MGIETDIDRPQPWGIVPAGASMTDDGGSMTWLSTSEQINPAQPGGGLSHPQVMSRVSIGF